MRTLIASPFDESERKRLLSRLLAAQKAYRKALMPRSVHVYLSTYCLHGGHADCRLTCKLCHVHCVCDCHDDDGS